MKKTLLEIVQSILNDMDSDAVNSIDDTVESVQVAEIVRSCFYEMVSNRNWASHKKLIQLDNVSDIAKPNYLKLPENLKELSGFKYDKRKETDDGLDYQDVRYMYPDEFLSYVSRRNSKNDNVQTVSDFNGAKLLILNDAAPTYWTSFDDTYLVVDSFNSAIENTVQGSKTQCLAVIFPTFTIADDFVPDLPIEAFSALEEESKSTAFIALKQVANQKAEQKSSRQQRWLARKDWRAAGGVRYQDFGRKSRK